MHLLAGERRQLCRKFVSYNIYLASNELPIIDSLSMTGL